MATKAQRTEQLAAIDNLRAMIQPGDTVYTVLRHVSSSGMLRHISVVIIAPNDKRDTSHGASLVTDPDCGPFDVSWLVARALDYKQEDRHGALKVSGCGMDMGWHLIYSLASVLYPDGFGCIGERCPSNDHSNGDRDYTEHQGIVSGPDCELPTQAPCWCHVDKQSETFACSSCGCHAAPHWHKSGGYAISQKWL